MDALAAAAAAAAAAADPDIAANHVHPDHQFNLVNAETRTVMQNRVNSGVRAKYESENVKFMVWLFDNRHHYGALVKLALLDDLGPQHDRDKARRTNAGHVSKLRNHVRTTCRLWLRRVDADQPATYPIELGDLTFQIYSRYLNTFKKAAQKRSRGGVEDETVEIRLSQSAFDGATSSLTYLYTECGLDKHKVSQKFWAKLAVYKQGSRRTSAKEKKNLGISTVEEKKTFAVRGVPQARANSHGEPGTPAHLRSHLPRARVESHLEGRVRRRRED